MQIQGMPQAAVVNIKGLSNILSKLNVGDKINAEVLNINGDQITLKLPNGTNVVATTLVPLDITLGDFIDFSVKAKSEGQLCLETQKVQTEGINAPEEIKTNEVADKLMALKMPPDERNIEIGKALIKQNIPINNQTIKNVINVLSKNEGLDIQKAAFVFANNIDKVEEGIQILKNLSDNQPQLGKLVNQLVQSLSTPENKWAVEEIVSNYKNAVIEENIQKEDQSISQSVKDFKGADGQAKSLAESIVKQVFNQVLNGSKVNLVADKSLNSQMNEEYNKTQNTEKPLTFAKITAAQESEITGININANADTSLTAKIDEVVNLIQKSADNPAQTEKLLKSIDNKDLEQLLVKNPVVKNQIQEILSNKENLKEFILKYADSLPTVVKESHTTEPKELLNAVKKFLDIPSVKNGIINKGIQLEEEFKELAQKLSVIKEYISQNVVSNSQTISNVISDISNNLNFMNNVNNLYTYYQLPVIINNREMNVDLFFVKNNKNKKRIDPDNATMFISLNTGNLGVVESLISTNFKKINFNFRLEDEETIEYFKKGQNILEKLIKDLGYIIGRISYALIDKPINVVNFEELARNNKVLHNTLDVRI